MKLEIERPTYRNIKIVFNSKSHLVTDWKVIKLYYCYSLCSSPYSYYSSCPFLGFSKSLCSYSYSYNSFCSLFISFYFFCSCLYTYRSLCLFLVSFHFCWYIMPLLFPFPLLISIHLLFRSLAIQWCQVMLPSRISLWLIFSIFCFVQ